MEATNWYKQKEDSENTKISSFNFERLGEEKKESWKEKNQSWKNWRMGRKRGWKRKERKMPEKETSEKGEKGVKLQSVIFIQHTPNSELAKRIRDKLKELEKVGNIKIKIVERTGDKLSDILHKSDSWSDEDCGRVDCLVCASAGEKDVKGKCKKRNVIYETYCETCEMEDGEQIEGENKEKKKEENKGKKVYKNVYIGESNRSSYERGKEHLEDFLRLDSGSHLLKHLVTKHPGLKSKDLG